MLKWRKPRLSEYIFVLLVIIIVTACLLPTCDYHRDAREPPSNSASR